MERVIGEVFDFNGVKLRVEDIDDSFSCNGCYFYGHNCPCDGIRYKNQIGKCFQFYRTDNKNVIFVEVE